MTRNQNALHFDDAKNCFVNTPRFSASRDHSSACCCLWQTAPKKASPKKKAGLPQLTLTQVNWGSPAFRCSGFATFRPYLSSVSLAFSQFLKIYTLIPCILQLNSRPYLREVLFVTKRNMNKGWQCFSVHLCKKRRSLSTRPCANCSMLSTYAETRPAFRHLPAS